MGLFDGILDSLARRLQKRIQGLEQHQAYRDMGKKGTEYSVESMVSESLANLMSLQFSMPVVGESQRARFLDAVSSDFVRDWLVNSVAIGFLTGDCVVVPSWNGRTMDHAVVGASAFAILGANGREITSCIYVVDEKSHDAVRYTLLRLIELVPYESVDGSMANAVRYRTYVAKNGTIAPDEEWQKFPEWAEANEVEWIVPNVDRLLIARYRSFALDPLHPNTQKGTPICFGASAPIREIHYLTQQMHAEFGLSEKAIIADKAMFKKVHTFDQTGKPIASKLVMPEGRERLFMDVQGSLSQSGSLIEEWAPTIQLQPYLDALEKQYQEVEKAVGVSSGILSTPDNINYQNVDNVRKSTIKTQAFIEAARGVAESFLDDLVYAWDVLANYYGITPVGEYDPEYKWSDEYINTFTDQQSAILAGNAIGATDAVDYRMLVMGESPEVARQRVAEIEASRPAPLLLEV